MAIVKMARARLTAFASERDELLRELQEMRDVHFADLTYNFVAEEYEDILVPDEASYDLAQVRKEISDLQVAIEGLSRMKAPKGLIAGLNSALPEFTFNQAEAKVSQMDLLGPVAEVRQKMRDLAQNKEDEGKLREQRQQLLPFRNLQVSIGQLNSLRRVKYALGLIPKRGDEELRQLLSETEETYLQVLSSDDKSMYFLLLYTHNDAQIVEEGLRRLAFTARSFRTDLEVPGLLADIDLKVEDLRGDRRNIEEELKRLSDLYLDDMKLKEDWLRNVEVRLEAREQFIRGNHIFLVELYTPLKEVDQLKARVSRTLSLPYQLDLEVVERDDAQVEQVPVLLENNALVEPFENVVKTFSTPRYDEIDPTGVVVPWFGFSFGFMLGDAGYGLVIFLLTCIALRLFNMKRSTQLTMRFFQILSIPSMIIGLFFGSFFALDIPKVLPFIGIMDPTEKTNEALIFSLLIGVAMLFFGLGVQGYMKIRDKDPLGLLADVIAWYLIVLGAAALIFGSDLGLSDQMVKIWTVLMVIGFVLVLLFSARAEKSWGGRIGWGAYNVYGVTSWIGDIVSYARLAALAMSGGFIGYAVNLIAGMISGSAPGMIGAILIILVFHPFNIFLSGLSAYVHTLRLVYVEFFGQFYEGGGKPFRPFRAESEYVEIK